MTPVQRLQMVCAALASAPAGEVPAGYRIREYAVGDAAAWVAIHQAADLHNPASLALFEQQFGAARHELPRRQLYLISPAGTAVGTATAWFGAPAAADAVSGRVHWVAIVPAEQGRGLAKPLLSAVCRRLLELGHTRAYLTTSTARVPALNLYFAYGFLPDLDSPAARPAWASLIDPATPPTCPLRPGLADWLRAHLH